MNLKRMAVMFTIMLITVLSASCFYVLSDEKDITNSITVSKTDYEKVHGEGPYNDNDGKGQYYIRYTGKLSGRTVVDLEDTNVLKDGKNLGGCGVTIKGGYPYIFGQKIESTYKMFSYISGKTNTEITRVFVPASIAIDGDKGTTNSSGGLYDENKGIASNTFYGYENSLNEKDVIYRTYKVLTNNTTKDVKGEGITDALDRTSKISTTTYPSVTTYICLDDNNVDRSSLTNPQGVNGYNGAVKNVYVSEQVDNVNFMFYYINGYTRDINEVLLDETGKWTDLSYMFSKQEFTHLSNHLVIPSSAINVQHMFDFCIYLENIPTNLFKNANQITDMSYTFSECRAVKEIPSNLFEQAENVTDMSYLFNGSRIIESIPNGLFDKAKNVVNMQYMFNYCPNLKSIPANLLEECTKVEDVSYLLQSCKLLTGEFVVPVQVKKCDGIIAGLAELKKDTDSDYKYSVYPTPFVLKYYKDCDAAEKYTSSNFYSKTNTSGKVFKMKIDSDDWEKVYGDNDAPYTESRGQNKGQKYFIHYVGTDDEIDLESENNDIYQLTDGYPYICDTKIDNTYKLFSESGNIHKVFIPSKIAIDDDSIKDNTFYKISNTQAIDCIYRTPKLASIDERGSTLTSTYDKTNKINTTDYPNVKMYVCLDDNNIDRDGITVNENNTYTGQIASVYVSSDVKNVNYLFYYNGNDSKVITDALIDKNGTWNDLSHMFEKQESIISLSENFIIPSTVTTTESMFNNCRKLTNIPSQLLSLGNQITTLHKMFFECYQIQSIPKGLLDHIENATDLSELFNACTHIIEIPVGLLDKATKAVDMTLMFNFCTSLEKIPNNLFPNTKTLKYIDCMFQSCLVLTGELTVPASIERNPKYNKESSWNLYTIYNLFAGAGVDASDKTKYPAGYNTPIVLKYYADHVAGANAWVPSTVTKVSLGNAPSSSTQSLSDSQEATVIDNNSIETNSTDKVVIEAETNYVTVTVNKKSVSETVTEIQTNSESVESVESYQSEKENGEE